MILAGSGGFIGPLIWGKLAVASVHSPPTSPASASGPHSPPWRPVSGGECEAFSRRGATIHRMLNAIDGVSHGAPGAFYAYLSFEGVLGRRSGAGAPDHPSTGCASPHDEAKVGHRPRRGLSGGTPGYARLSFALGDDDLGRASAASPARRAPTPAGYALAVTRVERSGPLSWVRLSYGDAGVCLDIRSAAHG